MEKRRRSVTATAPHAAWWASGPRRPVTAAATRQSRLIGLMKLLLPAAAAALIAVVVAWPQVYRQVGQFTLKFSPIKISDLRVQMIGARYEGVSDRGQPYRITAAQAVQESADHDRIALTTLGAQLTLNNGIWTMVHANRGIYRRARKILDLSGHVSVYTDRGYEFHSKTAVVDFANGTVTSDDPVRGHGPAGTLVADSFRSTDKGDHLYFIRNVKVTLYPEQAK